MCLLTAWPLHTMPAPTGVPVTFHDDRYIQPSTVTKVTKRKEGGDSVSISFLPLEGVGRFWKSQWEKKGRWGCYWFISYRPRAGAGKLEEASWLLPKVAGERL